MHYFIAEMSQLELSSVSGFLKEAEAIYNENLHAYVKIVLRRPFAKIIVRTVVFICEHWADLFICHLRITSTVSSGYSRLLPRRTSQRTAAIINLN